MRGQNLGLMASHLPPDIVRKIMGLAPLQYMEVCALHEKLRELLSPYKLEDPMRDYALQHFLEVAPDLSRVQMVDLMEDDMLPWAEDRVLAASKAWAERHPDEEPLTDHIRLNHQKIGRTRLVLYLNIPWSIVERESVTFPVDTSKLYVWRDHVVCFVLINREILIFRENMQCNAPVWSFSNDMLAKTKCMLVHGDLLYSGDIHGDVCLFALPDGDLQAVLKSTNRSRVSKLARSGNYLWVVHRNAETTSGSRIALWYDTTLLCAAIVSEHVSIAHVYDLTAWSTYAFASCSYRPVNGGPLSHGILVMDAIYGTIHSEIVLGTRCRLAVLDNRMLCAGTNRGEIHAWALNALPDAALTSLWTLQLDIPCCCIATRGSTLLYGGSEGEIWHNFTVVDDTGNTVHTEATSDLIYSMVSTQATVFARHRLDDVCWRA